MSQQSKPVRRRHRRKRIDAHSSKPRIQRKRQSNKNVRSHAATSVQISSSFPTDDAIMRIIDEWLVPRLVEDFIRSCNFLEEAHNGDQKS
jgi:hypothetical protein